jgi:hypothetical protein
MFIFLTLCCCGPQVETGFRFSYRSLVKGAPAGPYEHALLVHTEVLRAGRLLEHGSVSNPMMLLHSSGYVSKGAPRCLHAWEWGGLP